MTARALGLKVPALRQMIVMAPGKKYSATVSAHTRVLLNLGFEGEIVRTKPAGTWVNGAYTYAAMDDWLDGGLLGDLEPSREAAVAGWRFAGCTAFGPGTAKDLQWWTGWTVATTRRALADCGPSRSGSTRAPAGSRPGDDEPVGPVGSVGGAAARARPDHDGLEAARLVPAPPRAAQAFDRMGNAGPTIWVDGRVVGGWAQTPDGEVRTQFFVEAHRRAGGRGRATGADLAADAGRDPVHGAVPEPGVDRAVQRRRPVGN